MELSDYIRLFQRRLWLLVLAGLLVGGMSALAHSILPPSYRAEAMISVGGYIQSPDPNTVDIASGVDLAQTYVVLATTQDVLQAAVDATGFPLTRAELRDPETIDEVLEVGVIPNTSIIELAVTYEDPVLAANLANELARQLVLVSPTDPRLSQPSRRSVPSNFLEVIEWAYPPTEPSGPGVLSVTILGTMVGGALAAGVVLLVEYLDESIRTLDEASQILELPILGTIPKFGKPRGSEASTLITFEDPKDPISERYRALRINLLSGTRRERQRAYIVTSPNPEEGKTTTMANLAVAMAASGLCVLLLDADLRRPRLHQFFGLKNETGLTTLLAAEPPDSPRSLKRLEENSLLSQCLQETSIPGLRVITSGGVPPNPAELLGSPSMQKWAQILYSATSIDAILFDTPPVSIASDSLALAATTGASVVLVLRAGKTHRKAALEVKELFGRFDVDVKGVILNLIPPRDLSPYYTTVKRYYGDAKPSSRQNGHRVAATTVEGIRRYIDSRKVTGVGPKTTESIVNHFGLETLDVLEHHPERLHEVDGIGPQRAQLIARAWSEQQHTQDS